MPKITSLEIDLPAFKAESDLLWKTLCSVTTIDCLNCSCFSSAALPNDLAQQFTENYRLRLLQLRPYPTESYPNLPPPFELIAPRLPNLIGLEVSSSPPLFYQLCQVMENTTLEFTALKHLWLEIEISADEFLNSAQHLLTRCPGVEKLILDCSETSADFIVQFLELISTLWQNTLKVLIIKCNERNVKSLPSCFYVIVSAIPTVLRFTRLQLFGLQFGCASPATNRQKQESNSRLIATSLSLFLSAHRSCLHSIHLDMPKTHFIADLIQHIDQTTGYFNIVYGPLLNHSIDDSINGKL